MNGLQMMIDIMNRASEEERAKTQLTLGKLIGLLEAMPQDAVVAKLKNPGSYRGYYSDMYFEHEGETQQASELLATAQSCIGRTFTGYKGGDFTMGRDTPLWISTYGCSGRKLMEVRTSGSIVTADDD